MIIAAGLSPCWQQVLRFDSFAVGQVNRARGTQWYGSGKALNVAVALNRLGDGVKLISPLGGSPRDAIEAEFDELGIPARWIGTTTATRVCTTILDVATGTTTELVENAPALSVDELAEFEREYAVDAAKAKVVVLSGSIPAGTDPEIYRRMLERSAAPAILDARGPELLAALPARPLVVKPNREELAMTLGRAFADDAELLCAMHELNERGAQWVVVSQNNGPVWVASAQGNYRCWPAPVPHVVNPIGSGDCLAAGIAWALRAGREMLPAIQFGLGCAADNVGQLLAARIELSNAERFAAQVRTETVA